MLIQKMTEKQTKYALSILLTLMATIYIIFAFTPSHYAIALRNFGIEASPFLGEARPIRSDDWAVLTPYFQIAMLGKGAVTDVISPYHESLKAVWPLPILDWSLIFKPQLWAFWLLPPAYAYSVYFTFIWAGFLAGYTILLRQLGVNFWLAACGAVALYASHLVQVWWTTHGIVFAFAPWPLIVLLSSLDRRLKLPLLYWTLTVWIFSYLYPPFIISSAFALAVALLAFRRDVLDYKNIVIGGAAALCAALTVYFYFGDLFTILKNTVYPGSRFVGGGGVNETKLVAHIFPFFTTTQFRPLLTNSNECEVAVVSTFLPLTLLCFVHYSSILPYIRKNWSSTILVATGLAMMLAWLVLPVPAEIGRFLLWSNVQPGRMVWGFGLLTTIAIMVFASRLSFEFSWVRFGFFCTALVLAWLISKIGFTELQPTIGISAAKALTRSWFDWIAIVPFGIAGLFIMRQRQSNNAIAPVLFSAAALSGLLTFGTFNPLQQAHIIFNPPNSKFLDDIRENAKRNPNGWAVVPGFWGATINGMGIPSITHVLMAPELDFFRKIFPDLTEAEFNKIFNRYHFVIPDAKATKPYVSYPDQVTMPVSSLTLAINVK